MRFKSEVSLMRCNIRSVNSTLQTARALNDLYQSDKLNSTPRSARVLNDPYKLNELNLPLTDRYSAGVLDMSAQSRAQTPRAPLH